MKKSIIFAVMAVVALCAAATDRFYIEDFSIAAGETKQVSILLDNEVTYSAFQCDLYMPDGLTATNFALTNRKNSNHTLSVSTLPDGGQRCSPILSDSKVTAATAAPLSLWMWRPMRTSTEQRSLPCAI